MSRVSFEQLLEAGVHFGHLKRKWNPAMAPYIFMERNGIHIIDLHKTVVKVDEAAEAGIGVINVDSAINPEAKDVTTVYSNNWENGREVGLAYIHAIGPDKPIVGVHLAGNKGNYAGWERRTGLFAGIIQGRLGIQPNEADDLAKAFEKQLIDTGKAENASAKFKMNALGWGNWDKNGGLAAAEDMIAANPDLNLMTGENDQMLLGALGALKNANLYGKVDLLASADGAKEAYDLIKDPESHYIATGENSPTKVSLKALEIAEEIIVKGKDMWSYDEIIKTEAFAVTKDNVAEHYDYGF